MEHVERLGSALNEIDHALRLDPGNEEFREYRKGIDARKQLLEHTGDSEMLSVVTPLAMDVGSSFVESGEVEEIVRVFGVMHEQLFEEMGVRTPRLRIRFEERLGRDHLGYVIMIDEVPYDEGRAPTGRLFAFAAASEVDGEAEDVRHAKCGIRGAFISQSDTERVQELGRPVLSRAEFVSWHVRCAVLRNLDTFFGTQELMNLLEMRKAPFIEQLRGCPQLLGDVLLVCQALVAEMVPIRGLNEIAHTALSLLRDGGDIGTVVARVRCNEGVRPLLPGNSGRLRLLRVCEALEAELARSLTIEDDAAPVSARPTLDRDMLVRWLNAEIGDPGTCALVVSSEQIRAHLSLMLRHTSHAAPVLFIEELVPELTDQVAEELAWPPSK